MGVVVAAAYVTDGNFEASHLQLHHVGLAASYHFITVVMEYVLRDEVRRAEDRVALADGHDVRRAFAVAFEDVCDVVEERQVACPRAAASGHVAGALLLHEQGRLQHWLAVQQVQYDPQAVLVVGPAPDPVPQPVYGEHVVAFDHNLALARSVNLVQMGRHAWVYVGCALGDEQVADFVCGYGQRHIAQTVKHERLDPVFHP